MESIKGNVGMKFAEGTVVETSTGRLTKPVPKMDLTSFRKARNSVDRLRSWLMSEALAEAKSRKDTFNELSFQPRDSYSTADLDGADEYLFWVDAAGS